METRSKLGKADLIEAVLKHEDVQEASIPKRDVAVVVSALFEKITEALANGHAIQITGFGVFEPRTLKARKARNFHTGETIDVPDKVVPRFKPSNNLKDILAKKTNA